MQLYLSADDAAADPARPVHWLAGFAVVDVAAGSTATVDLPLERRSFETWSTDAAGWTLRPGAYGVRVGRSSRDLRLETALTVRG